jgi:hypothetical protein
MAEYNENTITGSSYTRAKQIRIDYPRGGIPTVLIRREQIINTATEAISVNTTDVIKELSSLSDEFPLRDPTTNTIVEGQTASLQDLFVLLYSAVIHLMEEADSQ